MMNFTIGIIIGGLLIFAYFQYGKKKWRKKRAKESSIFQLVESSKDIIYYYELKPEYKHIYTNPSVEDYLGKGTIDKLKSNSNMPFEMIHPDDYEIMQRKISGKIDFNKEIIQRFRDNEGNYKYFEEYATPIYKNGELVAIQGIMRNIDDKIKFQQKLEYQITHDTLTGIYNRNYFDKMMEKYNCLINTSVGIILCDLDELKNKNDTYGHKAGDQLIQETATLLNEYFNNNAIVTRIGGDEFVVIIVDQAEDEVENLCVNLQHAINHYNEDRTKNKIKLSMGYAFSEKSNEQMDQLLIEADRRMYEDKRSKKQVH